MQKMITRVIKSCKDGSCSAINPEAQEINKQLNQLLNLLETHGKTIKNVKKECGFDLKDYLPGGKSNGIALSGWQYTRIANMLKLPHDQVRPKSNGVLAVLA